MTDKDKKNYRVLFIISLIATVGLLFITYSLDSRLKKYKESETIPATVYSELKTEFDALRDISEADDLWMLENNPKKALKQFKSITTSDKNIERKLERRIQRVEEVLQSQNDDELTKINLRSELSDLAQERDSLNSYLDSIQERYRFSYNQLTQKNDSLEYQLGNKSEKLIRKETVKAISFKSDKDILIHYIGETKNEMASGNGVGIWLNGSVYRGQWKDNKPHGEGQFQWPDGAEYVGDFKMGERTGKGTFTYTTGEKYEGEFKNGLRSGSGILYDIDGNVSFDGKWKKDKPIQ